MPRLFVDADACPVRDEAMRVADRHGVPVYLVSNRGFRTTDRPNVSNILVSDALDAADDWIAERAGPGDVVVTDDIPLASRCLEAGAAAIGSTGKPFTTQSIGMALAMRELMSDLRAMGEVSGSGRGFDKRDRSRFLEALERLVRESAG